MGSILHRAVSWRIAQAAGIDPARISFAGPGKRDDELEAAIAAGVTLNLESEGEARRALAIGERIGPQAASWRSGSIPTLNCAGRA